MKNFLIKLWHLINSPIADIIGGYCLVAAGVFVVASFSELTSPCICAFCAGSLITMGTDISYHGFDRRRKSSGSPDDDNLNNNESV